MRDMRSRFRDLRCNIETYDLIPRFWPIWPPIGEIGVCIVVVAIHGKHNLSSTVTEYNLDLLEEDYIDLYNEPTWVHMTPTAVHLHNDEGWDRQNTGEYITIINARTVKVHTLASRKHRNIIYLHMYLLHYIETSRKINKLTLQNILLHFIVNINSTAKVRNISFGGL